MSRWRVSADTGGTFTDCLLEHEDGRQRRGKVLSSGRLRTVVRGLRSPDTLEIEPFPLAGGVWAQGRPLWISGRPAGTVKDLSGDVLQLESPLPHVSPDSVLEVDSGWEAPVLALRVLLPGLEEAAETIAEFRLGTTKGTNALLENKGAPVALFLTGGFADLLRIRDQKRPDLFARHIQLPEPLYRKVYGIPGRLDATGKEIEPLDEEGLAFLASQALEAGCTVAAVSLLHSWQEPAHEMRVARILRSCGFATVRCSSEVRPLLHYLNRTDTVLVDAALAPVMESYLDRVQAALGDSALRVMSSAGGLVSRERFHPVDSLVSGPAGGVLGAVHAGRCAGLERIIALDMGGTSTDVSRWHRNLALRQSVSVGPARVLTPAMPIETVAAGGGSICGFRDNRLFVGPESAGADPGPAAYGAGGPLTLTDLHLLLGRIDPEGFSIPVRLPPAREALESVARASATGDLPALAEGFLAIATERMAQAIRQVSLREGEDPAHYSLAAFGGAGGLHACRLADLLEMKDVLLPPEAGILSARGIHNAALEAVTEGQLLGPLGERAASLESGFSSLLEEARRALARDGIPANRTGPPERTAFLRLAGQENALPVPCPPGTDLAAAFREVFVATFGYYPEGARLELVKLRLHLRESRGEPPGETFPEDGPLAEPAGSVEPLLLPGGTRIPVFQREQLQPGMRLEGPAILRDPFGTAFLEAGWTGVAGTGGSLRLVRRVPGSPRGAPELRAVERTLVLNRLENLVSEMGDQLRRTALSTNIRERLDFSCALLDEHGRLLVNAPHIPVHLGAMGLCVRQATRAHDPGPGDVLVTNHPAFGGSHLPDVTLLCGLFDDQGRRLGFLANRAHHAELGGRHPGSMPADAQSLDQEGVLIPPTWLVRGGEEFLGALEQHLAGAPYPSRSPGENRIDLEAQLASLQRGRSLFAALLGDYPAGVVREHFHACFAEARDALQSRLLEDPPPPGEARVELDDGHWLEVRQAVRNGRLEVAVTASTERHPGNLNATPAIVRSALLYAVRLLVDRPMPLNEGLLEAVRLDLPRSFLNPEFPEDPAHCPAVVGGNVETSQQLVEGLLRAFGLMAASQGTMNNFLFGNDRFGYYETIGGGAGAGPGFPGASGVHVHMTNTAITDPEILEQRYPVQCREFSLRRGSGGLGQWDGGEGLCREIRFLEPVSVSLLALSRRQPPRGACGGGDAAPGRQWRIRIDGTRVEIPGMAQLQLEAGESIRIETPGGGAWGAQKSIL